MSENMTKSSEFDDVLKEQKKLQRKEKFKNDFPLYLMMLPGLIYLFINNYMPLPGLVVAFKQYNARKGIYGSPWAGLGNFKYLFQTNDAWLITRNTILYNSINFMPRDSVCNIDNFNKLNHN